MGLSSKQVSSDRLDWNKTLLQTHHQNMELPKRPPMKRQHQQQNHQSSEPLKCPRCDSTNTKFCYYNNYSESQPRHYCRACKRHWTKGGTLRNVPVGGGRKNKRIKRTAESSPSRTSAATADSNNRSTVASTPASNSMDCRLSSHVAIQTPQQRQNLPLDVGRKNPPPGVLYQPMNRHTSNLMPQHDLINTCDLDSKVLMVGTKNGVLMGESAANLSLSESQCLQFPFSSSSTFDTSLSSITTSFQPSNVYDHGDELIKTIDEPTINGIMSSTSGPYAAQLWQAPVLSSGTDMPNTWNWEDIDSLVSADLNIPWEDSDTKP